jgi:hypothetical protein
MKVNSFMLEKLFLITFQLILTLFVRIRKRKSEIMKIVVIERKSE